MTRQDNGAGGRGLRIKGAWAKERQARGAGAKAIRIPSVRPVISALATGVLALGIALLYFRHWVLVLIASTLIYSLILPLVRRMGEGRRRRLLRKEVVLWLEELTVAMKAGKSLAVATWDLAARLAEKPLKSLDAVSAACWRHCRGLLSLHYPVGQIYQTLAAGLEIPEIKTLAGVVTAALSTGANLPRAFIRSAAGLREQLERKAVLDASLATRRLEGCLLAAAPAVYTAFLRLVTPAYMEPLYAGRGWLAAAVVFGLQLTGVRLFFKVMLQREAEPPELILAGFQEDMALQLQAGLSVPEAWQQAAGAISPSRTAAGGPGTAKPGPGIQRQIGLAARELAWGKPFSRVMEGLVRRSGDWRELVRLGELLQQNYRLGGSSLAQALSLEAGDIRQRHLLRSRSGDAQKETWLLFPMILLLISALVLTAAPALLSV